MRKHAVPETRVPGAKRRIDPLTFMPMYDMKGRPLWDMPGPTSYVEHTRWRKHKKTGERVPEPIQVPIYRGVPASYARYVQSQIRRHRRKAMEKKIQEQFENQAKVDELNAAEKERVDEVVSEGKE